MVMTVIVASSVSRPGDLRSVTCGGARCDCLAIGFSYSGCDAILIVAISPGRRRPSAGSLESIWFHIAGADGMPEKDRDASGREITGLIEPGAGSDRVR